jgi:hypothetical protein
VALPTPCGGLLAALSDVIECQFVRGPRAMTSRPLRVRNKYLGEEKRSHAKRAPMSDFASLTLF